MEEASALDLLRDFDGELLEIHLNEDDVGAADASLQVRASGGRRWRRRLSSDRFESWAHLALSSDDLDAALRVLNSADEGERTRAILDVSLVDTDFAIDDDEAPASLASAASVDECYDALQQLARLDAATPEQLTALLHSTPMSWNSAEDWRLAAYDEHSVWQSPGSRQDTADPDSRCEYAQCPRTALVLDWCLAHADVVLSTHSQHAHEQAPDEQPHEKPTKKRTRRRRAFFSTAKQKKKSQQQQRKTTKPSVAQSAKPPRESRAQQEPSAGSAPSASTRSRRNRRIQFDTDDDDDDDDQEVVAL